MLDAVGPSVDLIELMDLESQSKAGRQKELEDKRQAGWSMTEVMHMEK